MLEKRVQEQSLLQSAHLRPLKRPAAPHVKAQTEMFRRAIEDLHSVAECKLQPSGGFNHTDNSPPNLLQISDRKIPIVTGR